MYPTNAPAINPAMTGIGTLLAGLENVTPAMKIIASNSLSTP
jgi:hypothetical protein